MTAWRLAVASLLALLVGLPLLWPLGGLGDARALALARNTTTLVALVLLLAAPAGITLAVLLARTDLPGRGAARALLLLSLFVPLPLVVSGWQGVLGSGGSLPVELWNAATGWAPWAGGIGPAAWLHAVVGLPWVVLIVGRGLAGVSPQLEEDELLHRGPAGVLWRVSLPRSGAAIAAALLWLGVQTATEITITDLMQVRTFAEEVYTQFVAPEPDPGSPDPLGRAVSVSLFGAVPFVALVLLLARRIEQALPAGAVAYRPAVEVRLGVWRWPAAALVFSVALGLLAVPVWGLVWKAGLAGAPLTWSVGNLSTQLAGAIRADVWLIGRSLAVGAAAGLLCATLALAGCWLARESRWLAGLLLILLAVAWVMPGPVVGLGLKGVFRGLLDLTGWPALPARLLWYGPSPLPLVWVYLVRLLPFAAAVLWPAVRLVPREVVEASRLDGAGSGRELASVAWPAVWRSWLTAAGAVGVLSLGELAGGKLVSTPGAESYAEVLFGQMHYGVGAELAARSLWLLLAAALGAALVGAVARKRG